MYPMKDVVGCDKSRRAPKQAVTREFPNGEIHPALAGYHDPKFFDIKIMEGSRRTEISQ